MNQKQNHRHRLIVISGPSCAGKSPLKKALERHFPDLFQDVLVPVLYNSRPARPGEEDGKDYHFRSRKDLEQLRDEDGFLVVEARSDLQAVDLGELSEMLETNDVLYEGNVHVASKIMGSKQLVGQEVVDVFLSPLALREVRELQDDKLDVDALLIKLMRNRLMRRLLSQKPFATLPDLNDLEERAQAAPHALRHACEFSHVIVCHDGEDSDHWDLLGRPVGDARRALVTLVGLLRGERSGAETWPQDLLPAPECELRH